MVQKDPRGNLDKMRCLSCKEPLLIETKDAVPVCGVCRRDMNEKFNSKKKRGEVKTIAIPMRKRRYTPPQGKAVAVPPDFILR